MTLLAHEAILILARRLMPRLREILIPAPTASALGNQHAPAWRRKIGKGFAALRVERQRADGDLQNHVRARVPGAIRALAMPPAIRFEFAVVAIAQERVVVGIRFQIDAAAVTPIAAGRTAARHELLATKRDAAVAAVARLHENFSFVNKHRMTLQENWMLQIARGRFTRTYFPTAL